MQIGCGDKYENEVVQKFNKCALSVNGCVPKRIDSVMEWPVGGMLTGFGGGTSGAALQALGFRSLLRFMIMKLSGLVPAAVP